MTDLLAQFRSEVPLPDEATAARIYARATSGRRRLPRRRLVLVIAVVAAGAIAGGLTATSGGTSPNTNLAARQGIVDQAVSEVQQGFGDQRTIKATLDGSLLTVSASTTGEPDSVVAGLEELVVGYVADANLRKAGDEGIDTISSSEGEGSLDPPPAVDTLGNDACDIPSGTQLANVTSASGRLIPLLGGFCAVHLTTSDPKAFAGGVEETLNELWAAAPPTKMSQGRPVLIEADDESGVPVIVGAWEALGGGAVYVRPDVECDTPLVSPPFGRCS